MTPESFRDVVLNRFSSHPDWQRRRFRWCLRLAFVPALALLAGACFQALDARNWSGLWRQSSNLLLVLGVLLALGLGFLGTTALCARLAAWRVPLATKRLGDSDFFPGDAWIFLVSVALGAIGPYYLSRIPGLPPLVQRLFQMFALFPLAGLLIGMRLLEQPASKDDSAPSTLEQRVWRRPLWLLIIPVLIVWAMTLWHDLAQAFGHEASRLRAAWWLPGYVELGQRFLGSILLLPLAFGLFVLWRNWVQIVPAVSPAQPSEGTSRWKRFCHWVRGLFSAPAAIKTADAPPTWLEELLAELGPDRPTVQPLSLRLNETSPHSTRADLSSIFGVPLPTVDQVEVLNRFADLYRQCVLADDVATGSKTCPDLLVFGNPGSGRTTALLACATYAAFVRGQRVLWIVPDSVRESALKERLNAFLRKLHLHHYVRVDSLSADAVGHWMSGTVPIPQVLLGTVPAVEQHLYGAQCSANHEDELRRLVLLPIVLIVDDLLDFSAAAGCHVPFLIDKQRLLLAAELIPLQVVISCRQLSPLGEETLAKRFLSVRYVDRKTNILHLQPRPGDRAWSASLECDNVMMTAERIVAACRRRGLGVVLYRDDLNADDREILEQRLRALAGSGSVAVIHDLESPLPPLVTGEFDALFRREALHAGVCLVLQSAAGRNETIVLRLVARSNAHDTPVGIIPLVTDRSASKLLAAHLRSGWRFLRPQTPIPLETWSRFGLNVSDTRLVSSELELLREQVLIDQVDEPTYSRLEPIAVLQRTSAQPCPVNSFGVDHEGWDLHRSLDGSSVHLGRPKAAKTEAALRARARLARWFDGGAPFHEIGHIDLAHACDFQLVWGRRIYGLRTITKDQDGLIRLMSDVWHGREMDRHLPIWNLKWSIGPNCSGKSFWGSPADGLRWFSFQAKPAVTEVTAQIVGLMSELGETTDLEPVEFAYLANLSALVFRPAVLPVNDLGQTLEKVLQGSWATGDSNRFSPLLTAALNVAIRTKVPGWPYFARLVAMHLTEDHQALGQAIAWVIEPTTGGQTASRILGDLLQHPQERKELFDVAIKFVRRVSAEVEKGVHSLRSLSRIGFLGDDRKDVVTDAIELLQAAQGKMSPSK